MTFEEAFKKYLPEKLAAKAIKYSRAHETAHFDISICKCHTVDEVLSCAFIWSTTEEGISYWLKVSVGYENTRI